MSSKPGRKKTGGKDFKPGNKLGAKTKGIKKPRVSTKIKRLTIDQMESVAGLILNGDIEGLERMAEDKKLTVFQGIWARSALNAWKKGDWSTLHSMCNRILGKETQTTEVRGLKPFVIKMGEGEDIILGSKPEDAEDEV